MEILDVVIIGDDYLAKKLSEKIIIFGHKLKAIVVTNDRLNNYADEARVKTFYISQLDKLNIGRHDIFIYTNISPTSIILEVKPKLEIIKFPNNSLTDSSTNSYQWIIGTGNKEYKLVNSTNPDPEDDLIEMLINISREDSIEFVAENCSTISKTYFFHNQDEKANLLLAASQLLKRYSLDKLELLDIFSGIIPTNYLPPYLEVEPKAFTELNNLDNCNIVFTEDRQASYLQANMIYPDAILRINIDKCEVKFTLNYNLKFIYLNEFFNHLDYLLHGKDYSQDPFIDQLLPQQILSYGYDALISDNIFEIFSKHVIKNLHHTAIIFGRHHCSYQELYEEAEYLASEILKKISVNQQQIKIAFCIERSPSIIAIIFAILRIQGIYIPLDVSYGQERIRYILEDSKPNLIITDDKIYHHNEAIRDFPSLLIYKKPLLYKNLIVNLPEFNSFDTNFAYINYTSGSTGNPKGVIIRRESIINIAAAFALECQINTDSKILSIASVGFDAIGWDIYGALLNGATVVLATEEERLDPNEISDLMINQKVSIATFTPTILKRISDTRFYDTLKFLIIMGDTSDKKLFDYWSQNYQVINGYGPTEATIATTLHKYNSEDQVNCIGKPLTNYYLYVIDEFGNFLPPGVIGEIAISGIGISSGYLNMPDETNKRFIKTNTNQGDISHIIYKTGDLGFYDQVGRFYFKGRRDYQVKISGVRIELPEIEKALSAFPNVQECAVVLQTNNLQEKKLIAFYTTNDTANIISKELVDFLYTKFHRSVIPSSFMHLLYMPYTNNGKIDRKKLSTYELVNRPEYIAPTTDLENLVCKLYKKFLNLQEEVGTNNNFFELGGHSIIAAQIIARLNSIYNSDNLNVLTIFQYPTAKELAEYIESLTIEINNGYILNKVSKREALLGHAQQRLWYLYQFDDQDCAYNLPIILKIEKTLDIDIFNKTIEYLIYRHESYRTIFINDNGTAKQKLIDLQYQNLLPLLIKEQDLESVLNLLVNKSFKIDQEVCWRHYLYNIEDKYYVYAMIKHNLITDAWSEGLLTKEFNFIYNSLLSKNDIKLQPIKYQHIDYIRYEDEKLTKIKDTHLSYWEKKLANFKESMLPCDYIRKPFMSSSGYRLKYVFNKVSVNLVHNYAAKYKVTPFVIYLTALKILIARYIEQYDVTIGTASSGRNIKETEVMIGFFVNTVALRTIMQQDYTVLSAIEAVKKTCAEAFAYQDLPFDIIVDNLKIERELNKTPLFQIMMVLQNANEGFELSLSNTRATSIEIQTNNTMFDLLWNLSEKENKLRLDLDFSTDLYHINTIKNFADHYQAILEHMLDQPKSIISNLELYSRHQKENLKTLLTGTPSVNYNESLYSHFLNITQTYPQNTALVCDQEIISYKELLENVEAIKNFLIKITEDRKTTRIAILINRNKYLVTSLLSITFAGMTYIPIDPEYPLERIKYMLNDSNADLIITDSDIIKEIDLSVYNIPKIVIDADLKNQDLSQLKKSKNKKYLPSDSNLEEYINYIIYTSGSTGTPKGVMIYEKSVVNVIKFFADYINFTTKEKLISITTISFDIFVLELWLPLITGGQLILCNRNIARDPVKLVNYINEVQPTTMQATPTIWNMIVDHINLDQSKFQIITGGEPISVALFQKLRKISNKIWNAYGPTEATIWSSLSDMSTSENINLGKLITNTNYYILDSNLKSCPIGAIGQLYIGGIGLARSYLNNHALTNEKFIWNNSYTNNKERIYKTGDNVKLNYNGELIFLERADSQVKLRGHRIELAEIENSILQYPNIKECVVITNQDSNDKQLIAYYITNKSISSREMQNFLLSKLPPIMIPSAFIQLEKFPLTSNKKIDKKALPKPLELFASRTIKYKSASTEIEQQILNIWQDILKIENISIDDNFFGIGGNSLHIPIIVSRISKILNYDITIRDFILNSDIYSLSKFIENSKEKIYGS